MTKAAAHLRITRATLSRVLNGKAGISAAMAIRLASFTTHVLKVIGFGVSMLYGIAVIAIFFYCLGGWIFPKKW